MHDMYLSVVLAQGKKCFRTWKQTKEKWLAEDAWKKGIILILYGFHEKLMKSENNTQDSNYT